MSSGSSEVSSTDGKKYDFLGMAERIEPVFSRKKTRMV